MKDSQKYKVQVDIIINLIKMHQNKGKNSQIICINVQSHIEYLNNLKLNIKLSQDGLYFKVKKIAPSSKNIKKMSYFNHS